MPRPAHRLTLFAAIAVSATAALAATATGTGTVSTGAPATGTTGDAARGPGATLRHDAARDPEAAPPPGTAADAPGAASRPDATTAALPSAAEATGAATDGRRRLSAASSSAVRRAPDGKGSSGHRSDEPERSSHLVGTWSAPSDLVDAALGGQTVRMVVRTSIGGAGARIRLSNVFGAAAVTFRDVHLGIQAYGAEILSGTNRPITFAGKTSITVRPGRAVWSDPIPGKIPGGADVVVSVYLPATVRNITGHERAYATTFLSGPGDHAADEKADGFTYTSSQWYFLDRMAVAAPAAVRSVVAFGDSLTDGAGQDLDANRRWTDYLRHRIAGLAPSRRMGVLNSGIAGNRLLHPVEGPSGLSRFYRDAVTQPGVRTIVLYEGINDISRGEYTSAKPIIYAYKRLIQQAHARKLRIVGATLTPFYGFGTWTPEREEIRQKINAWIRSSRAFDAVVDFDKAVRDPEFPQQLALPYDHGDHLHMSDAGRRRLAYTVNLGLL
ncbi:SGNH hydrolase [Microbispora corallina]|uniref:SGNH hydrolase n=1 Tax=Microbispora corallina TaxID=83302 RepID=A0ABQ4FTL2_9ACTN|nr:SGNH/GDSL hydrolase family protein [Microbispora corallina]GIH38155.1 SGNH hydrolase [Microbispora corallina]